MARNRSHATATDRASQSLKGDVRRLLADANVEQLKRLGRALGNEAVAGKLGRNDQLRDLMLAVVQERLQAIELAQQAELKSLRERGPWWRRLQRGQRGIGMLEPTRWSEPARLFREAADSICAGDLGRGAELLKRATENERTHRKAVPAQVKLAPETAPAIGAPAVLGEVHDGEGCTPTTAPALFHLADRIENVTDTHADATHLPNARHAGHWWEVEEEEDEEAAARREARAPASAKGSAAKEGTSKEGGAITPVREVRVSVAVGKEGPEVTMPVAERAAPSVEKAAPEKAAPEKAPAERAKRTPKR